MQMEGLDIRSHVTQVRDFLLDLLFPIECLGCNKEGTWLCNECQKKLTHCTSAFCPHCHSSSDYGEYCPNCRDANYLNGIWIAGDYQDQLISLIIKKYKYQFVKDLNIVLGQFMVRFMINLISQTRLTKESLKTGNIWRGFDRLNNAPDIFFSLQDSILIPVPLHRRRLRWRGFNQASVLAEEIKNHLSLEVLNNVLVRTRHTRAQAKLNKNQRIKNLIDCFVCTQPLTDKHVILVDDVTTTGATLNECAKALRTSGAKSVWGLVIAQG